MIIVSISLCQSRNWTSKKISTENHDLNISVINYSNAKFEDAEKDNAAACMGIFR